MDKSIIEQHIDRVLKETYFTGLGEKRNGKVRDIYEHGDKLILISTDRHSSFDRIIAHIPFKGQILNQISVWWFEAVRDIVQNHILVVLDPNVLVAKKCDMIPIEMVVRGYITGVTGTALWTRYENGERKFGEFSLPDGMRKNQRLERPVITPTTKFEEHDRNLTSKEIVNDGLVDKETWDMIADYALKLFARGEEIAADRGLILVDTKYEFGRDENGVVTLIDEIHTPDSSRYWKLDSYEERFSKGEEPEYFDKEFLRLWFKDNCDPYNDEVLPEAPREMVVELASRYVEMYETITGSEFVVDLETPIEERIRRNLKEYFI